MDANPFITSTYSNSVLPAGQPTTGGRIPPVAVLALILCLTVVGGAGCRNLYRQTQSIYPADSTDRLELRIQEAQQAERRAEQASATLHERLADNLSGPDLEPDLDRFEMTALDFQRRVASARDAALICRDCDRFEAELDRLEQRATQMQETSQTVRGTSAAGSVTEMEPETQ